MGWGKTLSKKQSTCVFFQGFGQGDYFTFFFVVVLWRDICTCFAYFRGVTTAGGRVRAVGLS